MNEVKPEQWQQFLTMDGVQFIYFYTPMCGTCQLASKMLEVVNETISSLQINKCNLNYLPAIAAEYEIESVPCLTIWEDSQIVEKIYAFKSVTYIYDIVNSYL
ncbi:thioredoxin family protein [Schinkia azotoformans]|uniref:thioredoxin family protein n=1 Tax=Schinkia azotoformans TaxID=1454 RepID=UPI002E1E223B|nr:thioredoxin family protein [Schinkia azotoformans]